jgi:murein DD-endopeptidase MepM/ murein hydrolase activator NlpD
MNGHTTIIIVSVLFSVVATPASTQTSANSPGSYLIGREEIDEKTWSAIGRGPRSDPQDARDYGMIPTGLTPRFGNTHCFDIDDGWAIDYTEQRGRDAMHGGIDIPAPRGTPLLAVAAGEVVAKFLGESQADGTQIWLRHSPEDTGLPVWIYTQYAHLLEMPDAPLGRRVQRAEVIGRTSNSGISGEEARDKSGAGNSGGKRRRLLERRDAVHFAVVYSDVPHFHRDERRIVPKNGRWMDPIAFYRGAPPFESDLLKAFPPDGKLVPSPYVMTDGTTIPASTKLVWPYACSTGPLPQTRRNPPR